MALPAEDQSKQAQPLPEEAAATQPVPTERGQEVQLEERVEGKEVTLETLEKEVEGLIQRVEEFQLDADAANTQVEERLRSYGGELTTQERAQLDAIRARSGARIRDFRVKALETRIASIQKAQGGADAALRESGRAAATSILAQLESELAVLKKEAAPETAAADSEEVAALKRRIENIKRAQGESAGGEHYRGPQAAILKDLEAQLAAAQGKGKAAEAEPGITFEEPAAEGAKEAAPTPPEGTPTVTPETTPPTPETEPARPLPSVRELLNIARLQERHAGQPEALTKAIEQAKFASPEAILGTPEVRAALGTLIEGIGKGASPEERAAVIAKLEALTGLPKERVAGLVTAQFDRLNQLATEQVQATGSTSRAKRLLLGLGKAALRVGTYVGLGAGLTALTGPFGGVAGVTIARSVEGFILDRMKKGKVSAAEAALRAELSKSDSPLAQQLLAEFSQQLALAKQREIDRSDERAAEGTKRFETAQQAYLTKCKEAGRALRSGPEWEAYLQAQKAQQSEYAGAVLKHVREQSPHLSPEAAAKLAEAAGGLFAIGAENDVLGAEQAARKPDAFTASIKFVDTVLGSKWFRGGEKAGEKATTAVIFGALGYLARSAPGLQRFLLAYSGMKAGELMAMGMTGMLGKERYKALKPVSAAEFQQAQQKRTVDRQLLDRLRLQLTEPGLEQRSPTEYAALRAMLEQHEVAELMRAESALNVVAERGGQLERALQDKYKLERERQVAINGGRIAGALLGAAFGPQAVEWIRQQLKPEAALPPKAAAPPVEAPPPPEPALDPKLRELGKIRGSDGFEHIFQRQLRHDPEAYGFTGDPTNADEVRRWSQQEAGRLARALGAQSRDGHTVFGLRTPPRGTEAGFILRPPAPGERLGIGNVEEFGDVKLYNFQKVHGAEALARAGKGTVEDVISREKMTPDAIVQWKSQHLGKGLIEVMSGDSVKYVAVSEQVSAVGAGTEEAVPRAGTGAGSSAVEPAWARSQAPSAEAAALRSAGDIEKDIAHLRRLVDNPAASADEMRRTLRHAEDELAATREQLRILEQAPSYQREYPQLAQGVHDQEEVIAGLRQRLETAGVVEHAPGGSTAAAAAEAARPAAGAPAAEVAAAGAGGRPPEFVKTWEDIFRGDRSTNDRLAQITAYLKQHPLLKASGGRVQFRLDGHRPVYSDDAGATFRPVDDKIIRDFVGLQRGGDTFLSEFRE